MHRPAISKLFGIGLAALTGAVLAGGAARPAAAANNFYPVPIGYTWDHLSYDDNPGDWDTAISDSGFDAGEIPGNTGNNTNGPSVTVTNNDPAHPYSGIPFIIGPTADGMNNVQVMNGQTIPVVPGKYNALYVSYSAVCGPHTKPIILNYTDGQNIVNPIFADWCAASQAAPDFFTWGAKHRNNRTGQDNNSCSLITKYVPVNANRTLTGVTFGFDQVDTSDVGTGNTYHAGGEALPGDTITNNCGRTVIGAVTLVSDDASLGGYGFVSGKILATDGSTYQPGAHTDSPTNGAVVAVIKPYLGNVGAAANVDGTYKLGLPPGTYTLSAAVRKGVDDPTTSGLQATPITVTVTAGQTVTQDITLLASADANLWGSISGVVKDASGNPAKGQFVAISPNQTGPFEAHGISGRGVTQDDGTFQIDGLAAGDWYVQAGSSSSLSDPVKVTVAGGGTATVPDLAVKPLPIGSIKGTVKDPDGNFGGLGQSVKLVSKDGKNTYTAATFADPPLAGTSVIPETGETATFNIDAVPAGDYTITLSAGSAQGKDDSKDITVKQGETAAVDFVSTLPAFIEGTDNAAISDPLTGALASKWTVKDIFDPANDPGAKGSFGPDGKITTSGGVIDVKGDVFTYAYQTVPVGDFAATLDVTAAPTTDGGRVGLMLREDSDSDLAANAFVGVVNGQGVILLGRESTNLSTFPFGETAVGTNPSNADTPGTQPALPTSIKLRRQGSPAAAYYSADGGKTEHFIGSFLPSFAGTNLRIGVAFASGASGTGDTATLANFRYANLGGVTPPPTLGDLNGDGKVNVQDATLSLNIAVGILTPTDAQKTAGDYNTDGKLNIQDTTLILNKAVSG